MHVWKCTFCNYAMEANPQVKVTALNWNVSKTEGEFSDSINGSQDVSDQNRVYTVAALEAVPNSVMVGWLQSAMGAARVTEIEYGLDARIVELQTPTTGGFMPTDEEET